MAARLTLLLLALGIAAPAGADCSFNAFGTIINPQDPTCGGVQYRYTRSLSTGLNIPLGYDVPFPVDSLTSVDGFRSYQSLFEHHQALDAENATVAGAIVGQTLAGNDIWAYRIGDADAETVDRGTEAAVMVNGGIHAREWQSPEAVTEVFEQLIEMQDDRGFGEYLSDNLNIVILPVHNIDGFLITQKYPDRVTASEVQPREGRQRRKNRRHPNTGDMIDDDIDTIDDNFWGIDLNRNSPRGWGENNGSSQNPVDLRNRGPVPQSEPEIAALVAASDQLAPTDRLRLYTDVHSFSQVYFTPLTGNARRDAITSDLVGRMRAVLNNKYRYGPEPSTGIGLTSDFFARTYKIPAWTLETEPLQGGVDYGGTGHGHSGFILPNSEVARMRDEVAAMLLAGFYRQSDAPRLQQIQIRDLATGDLRYAATWKNNGGKRRLRVGTDLALIPGNSYRLWLAFNKPMRWRDAAGNVTNYPGQSVRLQPLIALEFPTLADASMDVPITDQATWLDQPGGADGDGYLRYRDDALTADFRVPATLPLSGPAPAVLSVDARDMINSSLDADPASRVDWANGHWAGYEDVDGNDGDEGGSDCMFISFVATDAAATPPAGRGKTPCRASSQAPTDGGDAGDGDAGGGGGGGGGGGAALWLLGLALLGRLVRSASRG